MATKQQKMAEQLLIRKAEQLLICDASVDTPNTIKEELSASPSCEMVVSSSEITTPLFNLDFEDESPYVMPVYKCQICGAADHITFLCSYLKDIPPDVDLKIFNDKAYHIICKRCCAATVNGACPYKCLPPAPRKAILKPVSGLFRKEELSPPPTSEMALHSSSTPPAECQSNTQYGKGIRPIYPETNPPPFGIPRAAMVASLNCQICGSMFHMALECSYLLEIPPDAKLFNESLFQIACKRCNLPIVNGACPEKCLPPLRTKVTRKILANFFPRKKLSAPTSSQTVVHSSSEERFTHPVRFGFNSEAERRAACESNNSTFSFL